jgi:hypothetical protein
MRQLWNRCTKEPGGCWTWTGATSDGYGHVKFQGRLHQAHRVAFFLIHGRWPRPYCLHTCDNRACVKPTHLYEGTHADNMADMVSRGRSHHNGNYGRNRGKHVNAGEANPNYKHGRYMRRPE